MFQLFHFLAILKYFCFDSENYHFCDFDIVHSFSVEYVSKAILNSWFGIYFYFVLLSRGLSYIFVAEVF